MTVSGCKLAISTKPSFVHENAWRAYKFYDEIVDFTVNGTPIITDNAIKTQRRKNNNEFFSQLFSEHAKEMWGYFTDDTDFFALVGAIAMAQVDVKEIHAAQRQFEDAKNDTVKAIKAVKKNTQKIKVDLDQVDHINQMLESVEKEIESLRYPLDFMDEGSLSYAMAFRKRVKHKDFCRKLAHYMVTNLGYQWDNNTKKIIIAILNCFFASQHPQIVFDDEYLRKSVISVHSRSK